MNDNAPAQPSNRFFGGLVFVFFRIAVVYALWRIGSAVLELAQAFETVGSLLAMRQI